MNAEELTSKLKCLLVELTANRKQAAHQWQVGGRGKIKLVNLAWDVVKGDIEVLGKDLALTLRFTYGEVWRFNTIVENYDSFGDPLPSGNPLQSLMGDKAIRAQIALIRAEQELSGYLTR